LESGSHSIRVGIVKIYLGNIKMAKKRVPIGIIPLDKIFEKDENFDLYCRVLRSTMTGTPVQISKKPKGKEKASILWIDEAITYLGLDRIGIKRPDKAIHRLIDKGALHSKKISGRLAFDRDELEKVVANGDHKRGRGRPKKG